MQKTSPRHSVFIIMMSGKLILAFCVLLFLLCNSQSYYLFRVTDIASIIMMIMMLIEWCKVVFISGKHFHGVLLSISTFCMSCLGMLNKVLNYHISHAPWNHSYLHFHPPPNFDKSCFFFCLPYLVFT